MTEAVLTERASGQWALAGALDFSTVPAVWPKLEKALGSSAGLTLSLAGVERANSAALALLLEARDRARQLGCDLRLIEVPHELLDLASMSQCEALLDAEPPASVAT